MTSTVEGVDSGAEERGETKSLHSGSVRSPPGSPFRKRLCEE
jgi:hypothetical protein